MTVCVPGATGYIGMVLMRLLMDHPGVDRVLPVTSSSVGEPIDKRDGGLGPDPSGKLPDGRRLLSREEALAEKPDAVFPALPHGTSADFCAPFFDSTVVFDLSADFRLVDPAVHEPTYGRLNSREDLGGKAVYGLVERYRDAIRTADVVAVPGCYPTSVLLPLVPVARAGLLGDTVVVNSMSGISGAGRKAVESSLFVERAENAVAYAPGRRHRHAPEMTQEIRRAGSGAGLFFTPHLAPMRRGIATTIAFEPAGPAAGKDRDGVLALLSGALEGAYAGETFVRPRGEAFPATRDVVGSNRCDIGWAVEESEDGRIMAYLFSALDNLVKGAAGQAVQCFNVRFGLDEAAGLPLRGEA